MQNVSNKICGMCGSSNLISDRSLGGKIVCVKCGSSFIRSKGILYSRNKNFYYFLLILLVILLVIIF